MVEATEAEAQGLLAVAEVLEVVQAEVQVHIVEVRAQARIAEVQVHLDLMVGDIAHQVIMVAVGDSTFGVQDQGVRLECTLEQECMFLVLN